MCFTPIRSATRRTARPHAEQTGGSVEVGNWVVECQNEKQEMHQIMKYFDWIEFPLQEEHDSP